MILVSLLETERLTLRPLDLSQHIPGIFQMYSDPEAMRFVPYLPHETEEQTRAHFEKKIKIQNSAFWVVCLKGQDEVMGVVNYLGGDSFPGMGYIIQRDYWGQGITVEAVRAALAYGFSKMDMEWVELWIDESNRASRRVAEKLGFEVEGQLPMKYSYATESITMLVYRMRSRSWELAQSRA